MTEPNYWRIMPSREWGICRHDSSTETRRSILSPKADMWAQNDNIWHMKVSKNCIKTVE